MTDIQDRAGDEVDVSVIIPLFNEYDNVSPLVAELTETLSDQPLRYQVIFVDDQSRDGTADRLREVLAAEQTGLDATLIEFTRHFGQTAAIAAGFEAARGRVFVPMDGDLQNDPHDIHRLVAKLDEEPGWDIVSGWRKDRQDGFLFRRLPSILGNWLTRRVTWTPEIHDFGCSLKAYRREVIDDVDLYGEMHRYLPAICKWRGARVTEIVVNHRPRVAGVSKYGLKRTAKVLLDLVTVKFLGDYLTKPIYFFGKLAAVSLLVSLVSLVIAVCQKFGYLYPPGEGGLNLNRNVLVLFAMMTFLMSILSVMMGVLSELLVRIYHEARGRKPYKIRGVTHAHSFASRDISEHLPSATQSQGTGLRSAPTSSGEACSS